MVAGRSRTALFVGPAELAGGRASVGPAGRAGRAGGAPASSHPTIATPEPGPGTSGSRRSTSLARTSSLDRSSALATAATSTARDRRSAGRRSSGPRACARFRPRLGARTAVREMPRASEPGRAADARPCPLLAHRVRCPSCRPAAAGVPRHPVARRRAAARRLARGARRPRAPANSLAVGTYH